MQLFIEYLNRMQIDNLFAKCCSGGDEGGFGKPKISKRTQIKRCNLQTRKWFRKIL